MTIPSTFYFFLNTQIPPFNNELARQAVNIGDRPAGAAAPGERVPASRGASSSRRASSGTRRAPARTARLTATATSPRPSSSCSSRARPGQTITVWGEQRAPRTQYVEYYADLLNKIGYQGDAEDHLRHDVLPDDRQREDRRRRPASPTGFRTSRTRSTSTCCSTRTSIQPVNNENFGNVNDPHIQQRARRSSRHGAGDASWTRSRASGRRSTSTRPRRRTSPSTARSRCRSSSATGSTSARRCSTRRT